MKYRKKIMDHLIMGADLPGEVVPGLPLVEVAGDCRVLVENHHGVTSYGCTEIHVCVSYGQVCICGAGLKLARMTRSQLVITGRIDSVSLLRRRK